jgi:hypothetical protein
MTVFFTRAAGGWDSFGQPGEWILPACFLSELLLPEDFTSH